MGSWRGRLVFILIVYFAGFATAIYCLVPVEPELAHRQTDQYGFVHSVFKSDDFAQSFNDNMHKCINYAKNTASRVTEYIKQQRDVD
jgi:hypothetical protein